MFGIDRYKELMVQKRYVNVGEVADTCMKAFGMIEEFRYLTYTMLAMITEVQNCNNLHKIVEGDLKDVIRYFKEVVKVQGVNYSKELEKAFEERLNKFNEINRQVFIKEYDEQHEYAVANVNVLINIMLIIAKQFEVVLNKLSYQQDFIDNMNKVTDFCFLIKKQVKPKKVSKYQNLVGKNLKNWRG